MWVIFFQLRFYLPCWRQHSLEDVSINSNIASQGDTPCHPPFTLLLPGHLRARIVEPKKPSGLSVSAPVHKGNVSFLILSIIPLRGSRISVAVATTMVEILISMNPEWCGRLLQLSVSPATVMFTPLFWVAASAACFISWLNSLFSSKPLNSPLRGPNEGQTEWAPQTFEYSPGCPLLV